MEKDLISVIIPVYNLSEYLSKSIDSVLAQTYTNFEIIAVDDGSTDDSAKLLKEYALKDNRVKPVFKENGGVSTARNKGIEESNGEFIYFLDGDDWIEPDTLEKMHQFASEYDIVQAKFIESFDDGSEEIPNGTDLNEMELTDNEEMLAYYFLIQDQNYCVNKLFNKSFIADLRFNEGFAVAEDSQFVYRALKKAKNVKFRAKFRRFLRR